MVPCVARISLPAPRRRPVRPVCTCDEGALVTSKYMVLFNAKPFTLSPLLKELPVYTDKRGLRLLDLLWATADASTCHLWEHADTVDINSQRRLNLTFTTALSDCAGA